MPSYVKPSQLYTQMSLVRYALPVRVCSRWNRETGLALTSPLLLVALVALPLDLATAAPVARARRHTMGQWKVAPAKRMWNRSDSAYFARANRSRHDYLIAQAVFGFQFHHCLDGLARARCLMRRVVKARRDHLLIVKPEGDRQHCTVTPTLQFPRPLVCGVVVSQHGHTEYAPPPAFDASAPDTRNCIGRRKMHENRHRKAVTPIPQEGACGTIAPLIYNAGRRMWV